MKKFFLFFSFFVLILAGNLPTNLPTPATVTPIITTPTQITPTITPTTTATAVSNVTLLGTKIKTVSNKKIIIMNHSLTLPKGSDVRSLANAGLALKKVDGYILRSGSTFSFNTTVGERTKKRGFVVAPLVEGVGYGGGVCKASTVLYQTAKMAGLVIVERHNHVPGVSYASPGTDAMVDWLSHKDNQFRNNKSFDLLFKCGMIGRTMYVSIYKN